MNAPRSTKGHYTPWFTHTPPSPQLLAPPLGLASCVLSPSSPHLTWEFLQRFHPFHLNYQLFCLLSMDFHYYKNKFPPKKGLNPVSLSNYCPISLFPFLAKLSWNNNDKELCLPIPIIFLSFLLETTPSRHIKTSLTLVTWDLLLLLNVVVTFSPSLIQSISSLWPCQSLTVPWNNFIRKHPEHWPIISPSSSSSPSTSHHSTNEDQFLDLFYFPLCPHSLSNLIQSSLTTLKVVCTLRILQGLYPQPRGLSWTPDLCIQQIPWDI